jgi:hypothetical protein
VSVTRPKWLPPFNPTARGAAVRQWVVSESHHLLPLSWGGPDEPENLSRLSAQLHYDAHACMNEYVRHNGQPPPSVLAVYSTKAQDLAAYAWGQRDPSHPTPYWMPAAAPIHVEEVDGVGRVAVLMGWPEVTIPRG